MRFLRVLINLSALPLAEDSPAEDRPAVRTFRRLHTIWFPQGRRSDQTQTPLGFCNRGATASVGPGQLFTINAFVRSGEQAKQIPLVFVLMSGKILDLLPSSISVRKVTLDFERAVWTVFRELLPDVAFKGYLFHWTQALWRKVRIIYYQPSNKSTKRVNMTNTKSIHTNGEKKNRQTNRKSYVMWLIMY